MSVAEKLLRPLVRRLMNRIAPGIHSPAAVRGLSGWRRVYGELAWQLNYGLGEMLMSRLRMRWVKLKNPHAEISFEGYCRLGPGFSLSLPEGGRFIAGKHNDFRRGFRAEVGPRGTIRIGDLCVFSYYSLIQCDTSIEIGDRAMFGQSSIVVDGNHRFRDPSQPLAGSGYDYKAIKIENDVTTLTKVTIVDNLGLKSVVGANSVVTKPVPAYSLVAGVPARLLDYFGPPELEPEAWKERKRKKGIAEPPSRGARLEVSGHSISFGGGVSDFANRFATRLADRLDLDEQNRSISGALACWPQGDGRLGDGGYAHVLQTFTRPSEFGAGAAPRAAVSYYGLNDLALLGADGLAPFTHALRTIVGRHRAAAVFEQDHASVAYEGSWAARDGAGDCSGAGVMETAAAGDSLTVSVPADFPGGVVALGFVAAGDGRLELDVDGEASGVELGGAVEPLMRQPIGVLVRLGSLAPGAHRIVASVGATSAPLGFDYWQVETAESPVVALPLGYRLIDWNHHYSDWPYHPSEETLPALNDAVRGVAGEFGDGAIAVETDSVLGVNERLFSWEGVYPNDAGHALLAEAIHTELAGALAERQAA